MKDRAYAKINLALDVFNIREDGYHDINSIMIPINFYDELEINISNTDSFECNKKMFKYNEKNSIVKMINILKKRYNINDHYYIKLNKVIPTQAGLGGGTADAASTLRIFKKLYHLNLTKEEERDICVEVGADVLYNYYNKPAIVSGIGDHIEPFEMKKEFHVLIVKPKQGISTKEAYEKLDMKLCEHPNIEKLKEALIKGDSIDGLLGNSLEQPAFILNSEIENVKKQLINNGGSNVLMSGSGSSVFAISENYEEISNLSEIMKNSQYYVRLTKSKAY